MPYFIYRIGPLRTLKCLGEAAGYREAKQGIREARDALPPDSPDTIRMIFAANALEAEDLLANPKPPPPEGEDD
ncbi:MAG: hypothetical protein H6934_07650 [Burkholderiaceae bacterium]|nr:hypothetical protein [Burkholderiaceae bacterium]